MAGEIDDKEVQIGSDWLPGTLRIPQKCKGLILFVHGSGSSRLSPRNIMVAQALNEANFATLLFDLLSPEEEYADNRAKVFDIPLLAKRVVEAISWVDKRSPLRHAPLGLFGASTGAAAALVAAAHLGTRVGAVVSRGGRPDMAEAALPRVKAPTLLIVGGADHEVLKLNRSAFEQLSCTKVLEVVPGATHLFSERGAMDQVVALAILWFEKHLIVSSNARSI